MRVSVVRQVVLSVRLLTMVFVVGSGAKCVRVTVLFENASDDDRLGRGEMVRREVPMVVLETRGMVVMFGKIEPGMMNGMEKVADEERVELAGNGVTVRVERDSPEAVRLLVVESVALTIV